MITLLKAGIVIGGLWWLAQRTRAGAAAIAEVKNCPPGTVSGPWFTCVPQCNTAAGEFVAYTDSGKAFCAHHGTITDEGGNAAGSGDFDPSVGVDGNTVSVDVRETEEQRPSDVRGWNPFTGLGL